jgi:hypothetical protein
MTPLYTMLLCLPAGLALLMAVCGLAVLGTQPTARAQRAALAQPERALSPSAVVRGGTRELEWSVASVHLAQRSQRLGPRTLRGPLPSCFTATSLGAMSETEATASLPVGAIPGRRQWHLWLWAGCLYYHRRKSRPISSVRK